MEDFVSATTWLRKVILGGKKAYNQIDKREFFNRRLGEFLSNIFKHFKLHISQGRTLHWLIEFAFNLTRQREKNEERKRKKKL